ncbi:MAG: hypothetical protein KUL77_08080 [Thermomonas sp.]|uniref:hypothetical protein n=1 Tax=Thermomonas sp. TaxID=1971895 RepID=UPI001EB48FC3|nr:hypothetical protein [Thermomonas sp.]MBV2209505.1 hypothetical protein [Thermomonas sp.]
MDEILERVWDGAGDAWEWLRGVILGEWEDNRSLSQCVTDALAGFVPVIGTVITVRDLIAVIVRLAKHPEKRDDVDEWVLLIAMLLPLILTAITALAAGVGALVGAELGGFLRAIALFVVKKGGVALRVIIEFMQAHGYGDAIKAMREVKFAKYKDALIKGLGEHISKLETLVRRVQTRLKKLSPESLPKWLPGRDKLVHAIDHCDTFLQELKELRSAASNMIPKAVLEMDARLNALLSGNIKAATQTRHTITTGKTAPAVKKLQNATQEANAPATLRNPDTPEPGNTRRLPERRVVALAGQREYKYVDASGRPVGAKPYKAGDTLDNPAVGAGDWKKFHAPKIKEGYPDLGPRGDYANFSDIRVGSASAGSQTTFKRVVGKGKPEMDNGTYYNRELPIDGEDLRASSSVKEGWNNDGEYIELSVPPIGHPAWREIHRVQQKSAPAGAEVPYLEELKFWEGSASSKIYDVDAGTPDVRADNWAFAGGKDQQQFGYEELQVLKKHGFISKRKATNFPDYDPEVNNIVPKDGPSFEVIPLDRAVPPPQKTGGTQ